MKNEWKSFNLGDEEYFTLHSTLNGIDKNKLKKSTEKTYPYITRSKTRNGLDSFVSEQEREINQGNAIIIGLDTQTVFYQESDFYTGQNVQILFSRHLTKNIALFMIPIIKKQLSLLNWGGNGATLGRLKKKSIILPATTDGEPDWDFMENYIVEKLQKIKDTYQYPKSHQISDNRKLNELKWKDFLVKDYFSIAKPEDTNFETLPFISAKKNNNGYKEMISKPKNQFQKGIISWNKIGDGGAGLAFYQDYIFSMDTINVLGLKPKIEINRYTALFITNLLSKYFNIFGYGNTLSIARFKRTRMMLPVKDEKPDFEFMEQYMKRIENKVLEKVQDKF